MEQLLQLEAGSKAVRWLLVAFALMAIAYRYRTVLEGLALAREAALVVTAYFAYFLVRGMTVAKEETALQNAADVQSVERHLGIAREVQLQSLIIDYHALVNLLNWIYIWGHWPVITVTALWLYANRNSTYRLFRNAFLISGAIGLVIFVAFPVAPPRLTDMAVVDTVTVYSHSYRALQPPSLVNPYAAMPSLHFGWNLLLGIALVSALRSAPLRVGAALIPLAMLCAIVLTANHYIIDAPAGAVVALTGLFVAYLLQHEWSPVAARTAESERHVRGTG
jgi:hypothetical protein